MPSARNNGWMAYLRKAPRILPLLLISLAVAEAGTADADQAVALPARDGFESMIAAGQRHLAAVYADEAVQGTGPFPAIMEVDLAWPDATVYRPAVLAPFQQRRLGLVVWGNGGCANDGASAWRHLAEIASHGYLVIAPGKPLSGPLAKPGAVESKPMTTTAADMRAALDWALAENARLGSPYHNLIDPAMIAVAGHSCGAMQAMIAADDPRVATLLVHNSGVVPVLPDNPPLVMHDSRLKGVRVPTLMLIGGESDVIWRFAVETFDKLSDIPVFWGSLDTGHAGTFAQPHGGDNTRVAVHWLAWQLRGDTEAAQMFAGEQCQLCRHPSWTVRKKNMP